MDDLALSGSSWYQHSPLASTYSTHAYDCIKALSVSHGTLCLLALQTLQCIHMQVHFTAHGIGWAKAAQQLTSGPRLHENSCQQHLLQATAVAHHLHVGRLEHLIDCIINMAHLHHT